MAITRTGAIPVWVLPDRLAKARVHAGLDQQDLADEIGVSRQSVSNWERGYSQPKRPMLWAWAEATGVDRHWLIWGEPPPGEHVNEPPSPKGDDGSEAPPEGLEPSTFRLTPVAGNVPVPAGHWTGEFRKMVAISNETVKT